MKKRYRIKKYSEIDAIFKNKNGVGDRFFAIYQKDHDSNHFRFALTIGRKYGNAVKRNLIKRQIRMIIQEEKLKINNKSFVIVIKPLSSTLNFQEIKTKIIKLMEKGKLMKNE